MERMFVMKKLLSVLLVLAMAVSCIAVVQMTTLAASEETLIDVNFDDPNAVGYNHDEIMNNSTAVTVTHENVDGNNVLQFVTKLAWETPIWKLGNKIKAFAQANPGKNICVVVSVDVKGDSVASKAQPIFRDKGGGHTTIANIKGINGKWTTFAGFTFISEATALAADENDYRLTFHELGTPNDGTKGTVQIDNLKVILRAMDKIIGYEYDVTETNTTEMGPVIFNSGWNSDLSFLKSEIKDGKVTLNYTVYNMSDVDIQFQPMIQVEWNFIKNDGAVANPKYNVKAKTSAKITFTFDMSADGKVTNGAGAQVDLTKATLRFDFTNTDGTAGIPAGAKFAIIPENEKLVDHMSVLSGIAVAATPIGEAPVLPTPGDEATPTPGEDATPTPGDEATPTPTPQAATGFTAELVNDVTEGGQGQWFKTNTGVFSAADVANNKLTVKFPVKNTGNQDIKVRLELQTIHKKGDGNPVWAGPSEGAYVDIPAGETVDLEYSADVKNGKISVTAYDNTVEYDVSEFFARIDIKNADGGDTFDKGMAFTAFTGKKLADAFFEMKDENRKGEFYKVELTYANPAESGDLLPVAFIAVAVVATAALVVVSRKKREEF